MFDETVSSLRTYRTTFTCIHTHVAYCAAYVCVTHLETYFRLHAKANKFIIKLMLNISKPVTHRLVNLRCCKDSWTKFAPWGTLHCWQWGRWEWLASMTVCYVLHNLSCGSVPTKLYQQFPVAGAQVPVWPSQHTVYLLQTACYLVTPWQTTRRLRTFPWHFLYCCVSIFTVLALMFWTAPAYMHSVELKLAVHHHHAAMTHAANLPCSTAVLQS